MEFTDLAGRVVRLKHIHQTIWAGHVRENEGLVLGNRLYFYDLRTGKCVAGPTHTLAYEHAGLQRCTNAVTTHKNRDEDAKEDGYGGIS